MLFIPLFYCCFSYVVVSAIIVIVVVSVVIIFVFVFSDVAFVSAILARFLNRFTAKGRQLRASLWAGYQEVERDREQELFTRKMS